MNISYLHASLCAGLLAYLLHTTPATAPLYAAIDQPERTHYSEPVPHDQRLNRELAKHISYPPSMQWQAPGSMVVIGFRLTERGEVTAVKVHSRDEVLNRHIIRCLEGRRLHLPGMAGFSSRKEYQLRLRFRQA